LRDQSGDEIYVPVDENPHGQCLRNVGKFRVWQQNAVEKKQGGLFNDRLQSLGVEPMNRQYILARRPVGLPTAEGIAALGQWLAEGRIAHREHVVDRLQNALDAFHMLFDGRNTGKLIVRIAEVE
jgi:NADPH-dependent curcumin reductase CurA